MVSDSRTLETNKAVSGRFMAKFKNPHIFAVIDETVVGVVKADCLPRRAAHRSVRATRSASGRSANRPMKITSKEVQR